MILHRYFGSHVLETLREAKLKTSRISSFNDPFEFLYVSVGKATSEDIKKFVHSRHANPIFALSKTLLEKQGIQFDENDFDAFLNNPELIEGMVREWPPALTK